MASSNPQSGEVSSQLLVGGVAAEGVVPEVHGEGLAAASSSSGMESVGDVAIFGTSRIRNSIRWDEFQDCVLLGCHKRSLEPCLPKAGEPACSPLWGGGGN